MVMLHPYSEKLIKFILVYTKPVNNHTRTHTYTHTHTHKRKNEFSSGQNSAGKVITRARVHCVLQTSG